MAHGKKNFFDLTELQGITIIEFCLYFQTQIWIERGWLLHLISCFIFSDRMIVDASSNPLTCRELL